MNTIRSLACLFFLVSMPLPIFAAIIVEPSLNSDASVGANFDPFPVSAVVDINQFFPGASIRLAPNGRTETNRPAPGVIEEDRPAIEFDLLAFSGLSTIGSSEFILNVSFFENIGPGQIASSADLIIRGYDGDDMITFDDYGSIAGTPTEPNLGFAFNPTPMTEIAKVVDISTAGEIRVDTTSFVNDLLGRGIRYAGISLQLDINSLPDRITLAGDTTFSIVSTSANHGTAPKLSITAVPEPSTCLLLSGMWLALGLRRTRSRRTAEPCVPERVK